VAVDIPNKKPEHAALISNAYALEAFIWDATVGAVDAP